MQALTSNNGKISQSPVLESILDSNAGFGGQKQGLTQYFGCGKMSSDKEREGIVLMRIRA